MNPTNGPLAEHFLEKYSALNPSATRTVSSGFIEALGKVKLPGNVRQLENIVRRAFLNVADISPLSLRDLTPTELEQLSEEVTPGENQNNPNHRCDVFEFPTTKG